MESTSSSISKSFYMLLGASVATMIGGAYLFYKSISVKEEENFINNVSNVNIVNKVKEISNNSKRTEPAPKPSVLTNEMAVKIYAEMTKGIEEFIESIDTDFVREERKKALDVSNEAWIALVSQFLQVKHFYFEDLKKKTLQKYKVNQPEFDKLIQTAISFYAIEQELFRIFKPKFRETVYPDKKTVKDAYIFHCQNMYETLTNSEKVNSKSTHPEEKTFFMLLERVRIDDEMHFHFKYTFTQIKYLIHYYDLYSDHEVMEWYKIIPS